MTAREPPQTQCVKTKKLFSSPELSKIANARKPPPWPLTINLRGINVIFRIITVEDENLIIWVYIFGYFFKFGLIIYIIIQFRYTFNCDFF